MIRHSRPRYLAIQIHSENIFEGDDIKNAVWNKILQLFGEYGASKTGLFLVNYDEKKRAILRCSHKALPMVHAAVASVTRINDQPAAMHVLKISGTIKALDKKLSVKRRVVNS